MRPAQAWVLSLVLSLCGATASAQGSSTPEVKGVTISCQTWGWEWGSDAMVQTLRELKALGVNWVLIHPYAGIRPDGQVRVRRLEAADGGPPRWLSRPIQAAHELGMKIAIKPHLAYWGTAWSWRGEIEFQQDAEWARFFQSYQAWLERLVTLCPDADAFVVGTELDRTVSHEQAWRRVIAAVRARTKAPLTYAANWTDYQRIPFWDALDVVGIQGYFPLVQHEGVPELDELRQAWASLLKELRAFGARVGKKVVFTELGYDCCPDAARQPWQSGRGRGGPQGALVQRRCLEAALEALADQPPDEVAGAFLWKWFPGDSRGEDFVLSTPPLRELIRSCWR